MTLKNVYALIVSPFRRFNCYEVSFKILILFDTLIFYRGYVTNADLPSRFQGFLHFNKSNPLIEFLQWN